MKHFLMGSSMYLRQVSLVGLENDGEITRSLDTPFIPAAIVDPSALIFRILIHSCPSKLADASMVPPSRTVGKRQLILTTS